MDLLMTGNASHQNPSLPFRDRSLSLREIADRLNASLVLDGSLRQLGNRIRVTAQLVCAADEHCLWSERYDRNGALLVKESPTLRSNLSIRLTRATANQFLYGSMGFPGFNLQFPAPSVREDLESL